MFSLSDKPIDPISCTQALHNSRAGALVTFEGWVRNHNDGRTVAALAYEAFGPMAVSEGNKVLQEARKRFAILDAHVVHRIGDTGIGDRAVWVGVTAEHRQEAFLAARWIMDEIKRHVPIWKKETYEDHRQSEWIHASGGQTHITADPADNPQYARQLIVPGFGREGQHKLADSSILVIGAGGLGCPALQYLAAAGVGSICIVDGDVVEVTNLHRQILFGASDLGRNKAEAAAGRLRDLNPSISIRAIADAAYQDTLPGLLEKADLVLDCTDGFESKYAIHDACWNARIPLVQASVHQFDGWVQVIDPKTQAGCYRCQWPEAPPPGCVGTCAEAGVIGVTPGTLGVMQATQAISYIIGHPDVLVDSTLYVDAFSGRTRRVRRETREDCVCRCSGTIPVESIHILMPGRRARELVQGATLIDIRELKERQSDPEWIQHIPCVPKDHWASIPEKFPSRPLILCCSMGIRTQACVRMLGNPDGIYAWMKSIYDLPLR